MQRNDQLVDLLAQLEHGAITRSGFLKAATGLVGASAASALLAKTAGAAAELTPKRGGMLRVVTSEEPFPEAYDMHRGGLSVLTSRTAYLGYNGLVNVNSNREIIPDLAESWEIPNPLTYVFNLRRGIKFHDGTDFDAQAVKFNILRIRDPKTRSQRRADFTAIKQVDVLGKYQVRLRLAHPFSPLLGALRRSYFSIMSPTAIEKYAASEPFKASVGTGPFRFVSYTRGDRVIFDKWDEYWRSGLPYLDGIEMRIIPEQSTALAALMAGEVDYQMQTNQQFAPQIRGNSRLKLLTRRSVIWDFCAFNVKRWPFRDVRARQAFSMALDRAGMTRAVYQDVGIPAHGAIAPAFKHFYRANSDIPYQRYDPDRAKSLLRQIRYDFKRELRFDTFVERPWGLVGDAIAAGVKAIGVNVKEVKVDVNTFVTYFFGTRQFNFGNSSWTPGGVDPDTLMYRQFHSKGVFNVGNYNNPRVDRLLEEARRQLKTSKRAEIYNELNRIVMTECPVAFLVHPDLSEGMNKAVMGYTFRDEFAGSFDQCWLNR